jgi:hypothetical protein
MKPHEKRGSRAMRGEGPLRKIPFMADFLVRDARRLLPESAGLEALVLDAG